MYVLHAHWHGPNTPTDDKGMLFWLEDSEAVSSSGTVWRGRAAEAHPFCVDSETAKQLLAHFDPHVSGSQFNLITLFLPTTKAGPQPSPQVVRDLGLGDNQHLSLAPWLITGAWLSPADAFNLLSAMPGPDNLPPYLDLGADVHYWQMAAHLVLETLAAQKILPSLVSVSQRGAALQACWRPVLDGAQDGPRLARMAESMPPLCRAEVSDPEQAPAPRLILESFLNEMTDALTRQWGYGRRPAFSKRQPGPAYPWFKALFATNPRVSGSAAQLKNLRRNFELWLRNLHIAGDQAFRVAFRLEAPLQQLESHTDATPAWLLHFLLQARDDPSLIIPAQEVWQTKGNVLNALNRRLDNPQEMLLAGLGHAARLFPPLRAGLRTAKPEALALSTQEAFDFLREGALLLEASGFGVLVPPWWNKPGTRLGVRLKISSENRQAGPDAVSSGNLNFDNLARYSWQLSVGETALTKKEFDALVALKSPLVQIRGQWVQLDPDQIEAAIRFWQSQDIEAEISMTEAMRMGLGAADEIDGLPVEGVEFEGWLADWMERFTGSEKLTELSQPQSLQAELRPYQRFGFSWLDFLRRWELGACLADDMGLGKTIQAIAMLLQYKETEGDFPGPVLLICPTSVVANWAKEVERFGPTLTTVMHQGSARLRDEPFVEQIKTKDLVLTSYAIARRDAALLQRISWFGLILDEAQNIKNPDTKQTLAIRRLSAQFRVALTGTPVENRLGELWSIMQFLNPGYLGSRQGFRRSLALPIERYGDDQAAQRLRKMVSPFILRRVKTDPNVIQDLPDKQEMKVYCNLSDEQATLYEAVVKSVLEELEQADGIQRRGLVLGMLMKLKQICNHPAQFLHQVHDGSSLDITRETGRSGKLARLTEMLEEAISVEDRVLIFTQFAEMGHLLKNHLQEQLRVSTLFLHGGTPADKREVMVRRFQDDTHSPPIFILSLKAGGTGLNLTRANHVFHFDRWWNPAVEDQATDRAFRIGQTKNVQVHKFICVGTLEEMIDTMIESKKALAESIVGSSDNWLTEMSTEELRSLVTLRKEVN